MSTPNQPTGPFAGQPQRPGMTPPPSSQPVTPQPAPPASPWSASATSPATPGVPRPADQGAPLGPGSPVPPPAFGTQPNPAPKGKWYTSKPFIGIASLLVGMMLGAPIGNGGPTPGATATATTTVTATATTTAAAEPTTAPSQAPSAPESTEAPSSDDGTAAFGEQFIWEDGLSVTISKPTPFKPSEWASYDKSAKNFLMFQVTLENKTGKTWDPSLTRETAQSANKECDQVFDSQKLGEMPETKLLNGRKLTYKIAFAVTDPKDVVLEFTPDFEHKEVLYKA